MEENIEEPTDTDKIEIIKGVIEKQEVRLKKVELKFFNKLILFHLI